MAQLGSGLPGLGGHPSLSLHSAVDGTPLLCDEPGVLSKTGCSAVAGVVTLLPELLAMVAPYPNSYRRFGPGNWAPSTATWGSEQLQLRPAGRDAPTPRRRASSCGSPAPTRARTTAWPCSSGPRSGESRSDSTRRRRSSPPADGRAPAGTAPLPRDLVDAADRFAASAAARELFGPAFVEHFAASRRAEAAACHRFVSAEERDRYLDQV